MTTPDPLPTVTDAAYAHVEAMIARADAWYGIAPLWYGWALREAFEAGALWERERAKTEQREPKPMTDLSRRLRAIRARIVATGDPLVSDWDDLDRDAEALQAENVRLRAALQAIADRDAGEQTIKDVDFVCSECEEKSDMARKALEAGEPS